PDKFNSKHNLPGCAKSWRACTVSPWVLKTITRGYVLQFARSPPPFSGVIQSVVQREQSHFLREEIISLLREEAISRVPPKEVNAGFYSRYFLVPKRDGNYRPILDLRVLNKALMLLRFRMLTPRRLVPFIKPNEWFITIDLKDAYFHIPIHHRHRRYQPSPHYVYAAYAFTIIWTVNCFSFKGCSSAGRPSSGGAPVSTGLCHKQGHERSLPQASYAFSGYDFRLHLHGSQAVSRTDKCHQNMRAPVPTGTVSLVAVLPTT